MGRQYKGTGCVSRHFGKKEHRSACIVVKVAPHIVNFFTKIIEAHGHLAFIFPVNSHEGVLALYATPDNIPELCNVIDNFPYTAEILDL